MKKNYVYISCWANLGGAPGIGIYEFDEKTGKLTHVDTVREDLSCGVTYYDRSRKIIYFCIEEEKHPAFRQGGGGRVIAFKINMENGSLQQIDEVATLCPNPTYACMNQNKTFMAVSNHSSHNAVTKVIKGEDGKYHSQVILDDSVIDLFKMNSDGTFGDLVDVAFHDGSSFKKFKAHPHCAVMAPSYNFFIVCDKGNDRIYSYRIDGENGKLVQCGIPYQDIAGSCPRYCVFHKTEPYVYVNHEGMAKIGVFKYSESGNLESAGYVGAVPADVSMVPGKGQSGIIMHPNGRFIYDIIPSKGAVTVFNIDKCDKPELIQYVESGEEKLRAFQISNDGKFLITTTIRSGAIKVFAVSDDGKLGEIVCEQKLPGAAYVTFVAGD